MRCRNVRYSTADYVAGALDGASREEIRRHLERCPLCAQHFRDEEGLSRLISALPVVEAPEGYEDELFMRLSMPEAPRRRRNRDPRVRYLAIAASAVLVTLLAVLASLRGGFHSERAPVVNSTAASSAMANVFRPMAVPATLKPVAPGLPEKAVEIALPVAVTQKTRPPNIRLISKDADSGKTIYIEMPASYRLQDLRTMENQYIREVSY